jgi:hypothetical protein
MIIPKGDVDTIDVNQKEGDVNLVVDDQDSNERRRIRTSFVRKNRG